MNLPKGGKLGSIAKVPILKSLFQLCDHAKRQSDDCGGGIGASTGRKDTTSRYEQIVSFE